MKEARGGGRGPSREYGSHDEADESGRLKDIPLYSVHCISAYHAVAPWDGRKSRLPRTWMAEHLDGSGVCDDVTDDPWVPAP